MVFLFHESSSEIISTNVTEFDKGAIEYDRGPLRVDLIKLVIEIFKKFRCMNYFPKSLHNIVTCLRTLLLLRKAYKCKQTMNESSGSSKRLMRKYTAAVSGEFCESSIGV